MFQNTAAKLWQEPASPFDKKFFSDSPALPALPAGLNTETHSSRGQCSLAPALALRVASTSESCHKGTLKAGGCLHRGASQGTDASDSCRAARGAHSVPALREDGHSHTALRPRRCAPLLPPRARRAPSSSSSLPPSLARSPRSRPRRGRSGGRGPRW